MMGSFSILLLNNYQHIFFFRNYRCSYFFFPDICLHFLTVFCLVFGIVFLVSDSIVQFINLQFGNFAFVPLSHSKELHLLARNVVTLTGASQKIPIQKCKKHAKFT